MAIEVFNRYENKFIVNTSTYEKVLKTPDKYMELDEYNKTHEYYTISNIYYDARDHHLKLESGDHGDKLLDDDMWLMEVKAEKAVPLWLCRMLSENAIYKQSFSKYGTEYKTMVRKKVLGGQNRNV